MKHGFGPVSQVMSSMQDALDSQVFKFDVMYESHMQWLEMNVALYSKRIQDVEEREEVEPQPVKQKAMGKKVKAKKGKTKKNDENVPEEAQNRPTRSKKTTRSKNRDVSVPKRALRRRKRKKPERFSPNMSQRSVQQETNDSDMELLEQELDEGLDGTSDLDLHSHDDPPPVEADSSKEFVSPVRTRRQRKKRAKTGNSPCKLELQGEAPIAEIAEVEAEANNEEERSGKETSEALSAVDTGQGEDLEANIPLEVESTKEPPFDTNVNEPKDETPEAQPDVEVVELKATETHPKETEVEQSIEAESENAEAEQVVDTGENPEVEPVPESECHGICTNTSISDAKEAVASPRTPKQQEPISVRTTSQEELNAVQPVKQVSFSPEQMLHDISFDIDAMDREAHLFAASPMLEVPISAFDLHMIPAETFTLSPVRIPSLQPSTPMSEQGVVSDIRFNEAMVKLVERGVTDPSGASPAKPEARTAEPQPSVLSAKKPQRPLYRNSLPRNKTPVVSAAPVAPAVPTPSDLMSDISSIVSQELIESDTSSESDTAPQTEQYDETQTYQFNMWKAMNKLKKPAPSMGQPPISVPSVVDKEQPKPQPTPKPSGAYHASNIASGIQSLLPKTTKEPEQKPKMRVRALEIAKKNREQQLERERERQARKQRLLDMKKQIPTGQQSMPQQHPKYGGKVPRQTVGGKQPRAFEKTREPLAKPAFGASMSSVLKKAAGQNRFGYNAHGLKVSVAAPEPEIQIPEYAPDSDFSDTDSEPESALPSWARQVSLQASLAEQAETCDADRVFGIMNPRHCDLESMFQQYGKKRRYRERTSSGNWSQDRLTKLEHKKYKELLSSYKRRKPEQ